MRAQTAQVIGLSLPGMFKLLAEQMEALRPKNKPTSTTVQAAKGTATLVNSSVGLAKLAMEHSKATGQKPKLDFLGLPNPEPPKQVAG